MSVSSELKEWIVAGKELLRDERKKHPYSSRIIPALVVLYVLIHWLHEYLERAH
ncbi:MAG: hypothetical protein WAM79_23085 [Candidatus Sulfotelmatobacter sp.]